MAKEVVNTIQYLEDSAGSIMTTEYVVFKSYMTVADAFSYIQEIVKSTENIYTCYVVDDDQKLIGMVSTKDLLLADLKSIISDIMEPNVIFAHTNDDQEDLMNSLRRYGFLALPVVDDDGRLAGIFTFDDAFAVQEEETTEDFEKMAAVTPSEKSYLETGVFVLSFHRIPWLFILMCLTSLTGMLVELFEDSLAVLPALVAFVPMLMNTGGNAGTQSTTLIIRGMALDEIELRDVLRVLWKELLVSLACGAVLAVTTYLSVILFGEGMAMAFTVSLAMIATIVMSNLVGAFLTFLAKVFRVDPAIMAAPLLTNIIDAGSLVVYFILAKGIMRI